MTAPRPAARRRRPAVDPRLLVGVILIVASVAGVVGIVTAVDRRVTVYAAAGTLTPGDRVAVDDLVARQIALDGASGLYLTDADLSGDRLLVTTVVRRGELVPRSAVADGATDGFAALVLPVSGGVSASVTAGSSVDVWSSADAPPGDGGDVAAVHLGPPTVVSPDAIVVRLVEDDGLVSAADGVSVEVLVPRSRVARLLQAIANGEVIAIVPAGIPLSAR